MSKELITKLLTLDNYYKYCNTVPSTIIVAMTFATKNPLGYLKNCN